MKLFVVGLPIGNIEDISLRAIRIISESTYLVCEDTRMFNNFWTKLVSLDLAQKYTGKIRFINDYNEERQLPRVISELSEVESAVLVSDAGMPLISDPGYKLVKTAIDMGWSVEVVPGPTAESAALSVSGLPTDKYLFLGFLPKKPGKRSDILKRAVESNRLIHSSVVIYESANRLTKLLGEIYEIFGESALVCVAVDLTKKSEKILRGSVKEVLDKCDEVGVKGEVTLVVNI